MVELIITEKPKAAQRIAEALADGKAIKKGAKGVSYYEITRGNKDIIVGCAVGHLFGLAEKEKKAVNNPMNLACNTQTSLNDWVSLIEEVAGKKAKTQKGNNKGFRWFIFYTRMANPKSTI